MIQPMTDRQRFLATMHYQPRDRCPICDFGFWEETIPAWHKQGLPEWVTYVGYNGVNTDKFFGMDTYAGGYSAPTGLCPEFETKVIEDRGEYEVIQDSNGVLKLNKKVMGSIPQFLSHTLTDRASWEKHFKWRLDPANPARYPADWTEARKVWSNPDRSHPQVLWDGSFFGWIRDWMGVEEVSYLVYDDPALFEEMIETMTDCKVAVIEKLYASGAQYDACAFWEDMCYNSGPLLAPEYFKRYLVPAIRRVTSLLHRHGCDIIWVDCDGKIDALIPLWLDAGVNCMFPIEIGTWGADPVKYRRQYGQQLLMMGGFDKHILARTTREIEAEVIRLTPLVEEGGFIPFCDHRVPPDVPYKNYLFYLAAARKYWGKDINLKPMGTA